MHKESEIYQRHHHQTVCLSPLFFFGTNYVTMKILIILFYFRIDINVIIRRLVDDGRSSIRISNYTTTSTTGRTASVVSSDGNQGVRRIAPRHYTCLPILEFWIPKQATGVCEPQFHGAMGSQFCRLRQAKRCSQCYTIRLCRIHPRWQSRPQT